MASGVAVVAIATSRCSRAYCEPQDVPVLIANRQLLTSHEPAIGETGVNTLGSQVTYLSRSSKDFSFSYDTMDSSLTVQG